MNVFRFLTTVEPPEENWRPYALMFKKEEYFQTLSNQQSVYALVGKIVKAHFNLPNPCPMKSEHYMKCSKIQDDICQEFKRSIPILGPVNQALRPMTHENLGCFCNIIQKHLSAN